MRTITVELDDNEFMELASMALCSNFRDGDKQPDPPPILTMFRKIESACMAQATNDESEILTETFYAVKKAYSEPSIERGMLVGGFEGMMDKVYENLNP